MELLNQFYLRTWRVRPSAHQSLFEDFKRLLLADRLQHRVIAKIQPRRAWIHGYDLLYVPPRHVDALKIGGNVYYIYLKLLLQLFCEVFPSARGEETLKVPFKLRPPWCRNKCHILISQDICARIVREQRMRYTTLLTSDPLSL